MRYSIFRIPTFSSFFYRKKSIRPSSFELHRPPVPAAAFVGLPPSKYMRMLQNHMSCWKGHSFSFFFVFFQCLCLQKKIPTSKADLVSVNLANVWCSCLSSKSANFCARSLTSILEWAGDMAIDWFFWICDSAKWQMMPRRLLLGHLWTQQIAVPQQGTTKTTWGVRNIMALFRTLQAVHAPKTNKLLRKTHHNIITVPHFI